MASWLHAAEKGVFEPDVGDGRVVNQTKGQRVLTYVSVMEDNFVVVALLNVFRFAFFSHYPTVPILTF